MQNQNELSLDYEKLSKEQLIELLQIYAKNMMAMDGYWFQAAEKNDGMDEAMEHDRQVWKRFARTEALRLKKFLNLEEYPGIAGLKQALRFRYNTMLHTVDVVEDENSIVFRILDCRVQMARQKKGLPFHPCLSAGLMEYTTFAQTIDSRFKVSALSCYPNVTDETCCCAWKFEL